MPTKIKMKTARFVYESATAMLTHRACGVSDVDVVGLVTQSVLRKLRDDLLRQAQRSTLAYCVNLQRAVVTVGVERMAQVCGNSPLGVSTALVVRAESAGFFQSYANRMAEHGVGRRVFIAPSEGGEWAVAQAALARAQAAWIERQPTAGNRLLLSTG